MIHKCNLCGKDIDDIELHNHLEEQHFISYRDYYELSKLSLQELLGSPDHLYPICPYLPNYFLPVSDNNETGKKMCQKSATDETKKCLEGILEEIKNNRYYQYFTASTLITKAALPHIYPDMAEIIEKIKVRDHIEFKKNSIFVVSPKNPGIPFELSDRNKDNLEIRKLRGTDIVQKKKTDTWQITLDSGTYQICLPQTCPYDVKHHSRYSILNINASRSTKKLKLGDGSCVKFWDNMKLCKSILRVTTMAGDVVRLTGDEELELKWSILRCEPIMKLVTEIYNEICKVTDTLYDEVFIKNVISLGHKGNKYNGIFKLSWYPSENDGSIKLSIL